MICDSEKEIRPAVVGSDEQEAIWAEIVNGSGHVLVNALAGSGKSFTCREAMHRVSPSLRVLYLAFNRSIVKEFGSGAPQNASVKTLNGIGHTICLRGFDGVSINDKKESEIIARLFPCPWEWERDEYRDFVEDSRRLVALAQSHLIDPKDRDGLVMVADRHDVDVKGPDDPKIDLVRKVMKESRKLVKVISFNDQIWLPVIHNLPKPKYDLIFVDEAQDLNACQHQLVLGMLGKNGRCVVVGDVHQAIYGWRGSDTDSIPNLASKLSESLPVKEFGLTVTRRCAKSIVRHAQQFVPAIRAMDNAIDGEVRYVSKAESRKQMVPGDMVVCRMNAPVVSAAYGLIGDGVKAVVRGRDIGAGLEKLIEKLKAKTVKELLKKVDEWQEREVAASLDTRNEESRIRKVEDKADCLRVIAEGCASISDVVTNTKALFADFDPDGTPRKSVVLSSIHRAKGLESDRVFWLSSAERASSKKGFTPGWKEVQEENLKYVATTRAKNSLVLES